jgi:hypothetical protein
MINISPVVTLSPRDYDAVLFDLDGVLTKTASVHAAAWKRLFDGLLEQRAADIGEPFVPFDIDADYRRYVGGKPRYDDVAALLASRGIVLPSGAPEDAPGAQTVHAYAGEERLSIESAARTVLAGLNGGLPTTVSYIPGGSAASSRHSCCKKYRVNSLGPRRGNNTCKRNIGGKETAPSRVGTSSSRPQCCWEAYVSSLHHSQQRNEVIRRCVSGWRNIVELPLLSNLGNI